MTNNVVIIGGGLVGGTLAIALANQGIKTTVIDRDPLNVITNPALDGRTTAISFGSQQIFTSLGIWEVIEPFSQPILDIRVFEKDSPWAIYYNHQDLGKDPMGYIVQNHIIRNAIAQKALSLSKKLEWLAPLEFKKSCYHPSHIEVELNDGVKHSAALLVGAEGRNSPTRRQANIKTTTWEYGQNALVVHVTHEKPHDGVAWEIFMPQGPLAFLPLLDCPLTGRHRSGIVWVDSKDNINSLLSASDQDLSKTLLAHFPFYGEISISGQRWSYPLSALKVDKLIDKRFAIVGDAAHVVHPIAGQGVNLGWRDARALANVIIDAQKLGLDIGSDTILKNYQKQRKLDHLSVLGLTDGINRLFSNNSSALHFLRNTGFALVNNTKPLKRFLMKKAMGL